MLRTAPISPKLTALPRNTSPLINHSRPLISVDLGASVGENYGEVVGPVTPVERKVCTCIRSSLFRIFHYYIASLATLSKHKPDRAKIVTS